MLLEGSMETKGQASHTAENLHSEPLQLQDAPKINLNQFSIKVTGGWVIFLSPYKFLKQSQKQYYFMFQALQIKKKLCRSLS